MGTRVDNTSRKLMHGGGRPLSAGFWFSLGHSTVVVGLCRLVAGGVRHLLDQTDGNVDALHEILGVAGTGISGAFLYLIGIGNLVIRRRRPGHRHHAAGLRPGQPDRHSTWARCRPGAPDTSSLGYVVAGVFVVSWICALAVWRWGRVEEKWGAAPARVSDPGGDWAGQEDTASGRSTLSGGILKFVPRRPTLIRRGGSGSCTNFRSRKVLWRRS